MENNKMIIKQASLQHFFVTHTNTNVRFDDMRSAINIPQSFMLVKSLFPQQTSEIEFHIDNQYVAEFDGDVSKVELYSVEPYDDMNLLCKLTKRTIVQSEKSIEVEVIKAKKGE